MNLDSILTKAYRYRASDIHLKSALKPLMRIDGKLLLIPDEEPISANDLADTIMAFSWSAPAAAGLKPELWWLSLCSPPPEPGKRKIAPCVPSSGCGPPRFRM